MNRITIRADNSQIKEFVYCPRSWYYKYILNLRPKGPMSPYLDKGTIFHHLVDFYYNAIGSGMTADDAYKYTIDLFKRKLKAKEIPTDLSREELIFMASRFYNYYAHYSISGDYMPLIINGKPQVEIGFSIVILDNKYFLFVLEGKIDLITQSWFFVDHKTQAKRYDHYNYDPQWLTYGIATGCTKVVVNYVGLQQKLDVDTFRRVPFSFTKEKLDQYKEYLQGQFFKMANCIQNQSFPTEYANCGNKYNKVCEYHRIDESVDPSERKLNLLAFYTNNTPKWEPWKLGE